MCGICGFVGQVASKNEIVRNMTDVIIHRGPDSEGFHIDEDIAMGFKRLSIIDLEEGTQPIYNEDKSMVISFNGEIYNYKELKKELENEGHVFSTGADTEVILHGFEQWKEDVLLKLRGMFAFAIWNIKEKELFLARDFFGIKPLHYCFCNDNFLYASEIKSILQFPQFEKKFNYRALDKYLSFQYSLPPGTFFESVYCLMPGHYLVYKDGKFNVKRYFDPIFKADKHMSEEEAVEKIERVFEDSVNAHKVSDVEVGCFLSSGVDSSYVSTYFSNQKTFTVGFDFGERYNEISYAQKLSEQIGVEHHYKLISSEEFWDNIGKVQYYMDQPLADPSCVALYFVSKIASEHVKVVLSGEGADELFGGYTIYKEPAALRFYQSILPKKLRKFLAYKVKNKHFKGRNYIIRGAKSLEERYIGNAYMYTKEEKQQLLKDSSIATDPTSHCEEIYNKVKDYDDESKMQYLDINTWMIGDILLKADRMSMANSLELRVPFLDKEVFEVARTIPKKLRINRKNTKYAMRMAALKRLPEFTAQKKKLGFPVPTRVWLRNDRYYDKVKESFNSDTAKKFFHTDKIISLLDEHYYGKTDNSRKIWTIYVFILWYDIYFC